MTVRLSGEAASMVAATNGGRQATLDLLRIFPGRVVASRRRWHVEHLHQAPPDARFDLGTVARDFDLSVLVPRVAQATGAVKGQSACRYPIHLERLAPLLPLS